jgi:hypothetical protein
MVGAMLGAMAPASPRCHRLQATMFDEQEEVDDPPPATSLVQALDDMDTTVIKQCAHCPKRGKAPVQWRNGPDGRQTLCNACGVRWGRRKQEEEAAAGRKRSRHN